MEKLIYNKFFRVGVKITLSLWAAYHVVAMIVLPNGMSFFARKVQPYVFSYANSVGLNVGWSFFSPDPANVLYLRYVVYFKDPDKESVEDFFPKEKNKAATSIRGKRDWTVMRFMLLDHKRLGVLMAPWICRQYKDAENVNLEYVMETVPPIDEAQLMANRDVQDLSQELQLIKVDHSCGESQDEILL